jgi:uncharacterized protein YqcC (DUF446 family)
MNILDKDSKIFSNKSLSDVFEDIYKNSRSKNKQITELIEKLSDLIKNASDATMMVPLLKEYLEISVKNDEQLVKLAGIIQKLLLPTSKRVEEMTEDALLPENERQQLLEEIKQIDQRVEKTNNKADVFLNLGNNNVAQNK